MNQNIYKQELLEHYTSSLFRKTINNPSFTAHNDNPSCGDSIIIQGIIDQQKVVDLAFEGKGCVISQASTSMILEELVGKSLSDILDFKINDLRNLIKIPVGPVRLKCAILGLDVLKAGIKNYQKEKNDQSRT
jgi:nitrogen fixation protein NifU and related proteins